MGHRFEKKTAMLLSIKDVCKTYSNGIKAIDTFNLEIKSGMFGLLGPNGAGKSSLMRTIATLQAPDQGKIIFDGANIFEHKTTFRKTLGYLPQEFGVYPKDSAEDLLDYLAVLKGIHSKKDRALRIDQVLELTNLENMRKKRVSTFSGGMRQRFGIAQLLLNNPKLIIVDEPTAGLDPAERIRFLNVLRNIGSSNIVIFSTHLVEDVKELCSEMAIINRGKLIDHTSPKLAMQELKGKIWETKLSESELEKFRPLVKNLSNHFNDENELIHRIFAKDHLDDQFTQVKAKLEDYYFLNLNQ